MLIIRKAQIDALSAEALNGFHRRIVAHLRSLFPQKTATWDEADAMAFVIAGIAKAETHQITAERDVARYIDVMLELGNDLEARPDMAWTKPFLADPEIGGNAKMNAIFRQLGARAPAAAWLCDVWPDGDG